MVIAWIILFLLLLFIEIITVNLVTILFALGALIAVICYVIYPSGFISAIAFIIFSIVSLILTKPLIKKFRVNNIEPTNLDMVIDKTALVTKEIEKLEPGEVKVDGKLWSAISEKKILKNKLVKVKTIKGVKLVVEEVREEDDK